MARITVDLEDELYGKLKALADDMERTMDEVVAFALTDFHAEERDNVTSIRAGLRDLAEGRTVSHEKMRAWADSLSTAQPLPGPRARVLEQAS